MLHDASAVAGGFSSLETPKPPFSQPLSSFAPNMTCADHAEPDDAIEWDWDLENADRKREAKADSAVHGAPPFHVDRNVLRDVIREKVCRVGRIEFLSSGTSCRFLVPSAQMTQKHRALMRAAGTFHKVRLFDLRPHLFRSPSIQVVCLVLIIGP
jgi:hypothetical protein